MNQKLLITVVVLALALTAALASSCASGVSEKELQAAADSLRSTGLADSVADDAARALLLDSTEFAERYAAPIVDGLLDGTLTAEQAASRMNEMHALAEQMGRDDSAREFFAALDRLAANLPVDKQMRLYAKASTPQALGEALRVDSEAPGADLDLINRQVAALRGIYSGEDLKAFNKAFNRPKI